MMITSYYISSQETSSGDQYYDSNTTITTTSVATCDTAYWNDGSWHTAGTGANTTYIPIDFKY
ncbi:MAG: hypothetical protein EOO94_04675 [Pedobacter sp.]|nr:MAG: hypothetical protein EOO94_04675 [Pedobacter sp.]